MKFNIVSNKYPELASELQEVINESELNIDISDAVDAALSQVVKKIGRILSVNLSDFTF